MSWLQLRLDTRADLVEEWEQWLLASGAVAVTLEDNADQPLLEPAVGATPLWQQTRVTGMYPADTDMAAALAQLPAELLAASNRRIEILEDKDWEREWMQHYQPMRFGPRLWVCPSWLPLPDPQAVNLLLDPGLAFGTGTHPTTAMCLRELANLPLAGSAVVDYGCGSGILAVAALKLGARQGLAIDNDPQALVATRNNAERNQLSPAQLVVGLPDAPVVRDWRGRADLVVANILAGPLIELADTLVNLIKPGGTLMVAGLLTAQADSLCRRYAARAELAVVAEQDGWVCLRGSRGAQ